MCYFHTTVKRFAAILLLGVLLFNWGGYRFFMGYLENKADLRLEANLDENRYNEADLITLKVATHLPYYAGSEKFERINGEVNVNGITYKYVERRLYNDTLELRCIPNLVKAGIQQAGEDFYHLANDIATNNSSKKSTGDHSHQAKFSMSDFTDDHSFVWQYKSNALSYDWYSKNIADLSAAHLNRLEKPPQA